jgi:hypothetical protein
MQRLAHRSVHNGDLLRLSFLNAALWQRESLLSWNARVVLIALPFGASAAIALCSSAWSSLWPYRDQLAADQPFVGRSNSAFRHRVPRTTHSQKG